MRAVACRFSGGATHWAQYDRAAGSTQLWLLCFRPRPAGLWCCPVRVASERWAWAGAEGQHSAAPRHQAAVVDLALESWQSDLTSP